jgi:hypothetical protein
VDRVRALGDSAPSDGHGGSMAEGPGGWLEGARGSSDQGSIGAEVSESDRADHSDAG